MALTADGQQVWAWPQGQSSVATTAAVPLTACRTTGYGEATVWAGF